MNNRKTMVIPIIILNYNSSSDCRKCISSLKRQEDIDMEVVLVDNGSKEEDLIALRTLATEQGCTLIENKENRGYNAGNNIGLRYASEKGYKYALIANPDMEFPQTDYLLKMAAKMEENEEIVVCGSDIITPEGNHQNPMRESTYFEELFWPITTLRNRKKKAWFLMDYTKSECCEKVSGCCFIIRLSFAQDIGFFDEKVFLYSEEPILAKQVINRGYKMYYLANAQAVHCHIKSEKGDPKKRIYLFEKSRKYYLKYYSGYPQFALTCLYLSYKIHHLFYTK